MTVTDAGVPITALNELEWVKGEIFANVCTTDYIARIDPADGPRHRLDRLAGPAARREHDGNAVLNGIAYDAGERPAVRDRKTLAEALRDQTDRDTTLSSSASAPAPSP